jgi:carbamoyltransferase
VNILGINAYHAGSSACLIRAGQLVAAAEEERFNRNKYWSGFPLRSIEYVLRAAGMDVRELDHIGISRDPTANLGKKLRFAIASRLNARAARDRVVNLLEVARNPKRHLAAHFGIAARDLRAEFHFVEHHRAHMASAFLVSPFQDAALVSIDGMGDFVSTMWGTGTDHRIMVDGAINFPHSLGYLYTAISQWLGFTQYGDEGKVMGLAPYGTARYLDHMDRLLRVQRDATFELDLDYFRVHTDGAAMRWRNCEPTIGPLYSQRLIQLLGPARQRGQPIEAYHQDIAASLQLALEQAELALLRRVAAASGKNALCLAGGVALNSVVNGKILRATPFTDVFIQPAAGDAGTAVGVCYYIWNHVCRQPRGFQMRTAATGPEFSAAEIESALRQAGVAYHTHSLETVPALAAERIARGQVVGWFQGRMEWGPRALGNRSIVADPRAAGMKDVLNARIKQRESFRPFAPSILLERTADFFEQSYPDPFMLKVYDVHQHRRSEIPAVTHVDGSGRLQTVARSDAPLYWELIHAFGERTGTPVLLNTSFNENEPIVCTPAQAIDTFLRTRMDALILGPFAVLR